MTAQTSFAVALLLFGCGSGNGGGTSDIDLGGHGGEGTGGAVTAGASGGEDAGGAGGDETVDSGPADRRMSVDKQSAADAAVPHSDAEAADVFGNDAPVPSTDPFAQARQECVDKINGYRATEGKPPFVRWTEAEICADAQAMSDSETKQAHGAFGKCMELAQNECPDYGSLAQVTGGCLDSMWKEGAGTFPAHGHYLNMSSTKYKKVACGFFVTADRKIWSVQDFR